MPDLPIRVDSRGKRWAIVSARDFARQAPGHDTWTLRANLSSLIASREPAARDVLLDLCVTRDGGELVAILLCGDEHHLTDLYDITDALTEDIDEAARRLQGRDALQLAREPAALPSWWTRYLAGSLAVHAANAPDVHGVLLLADWMPRYDPDDRAIPDPTNDGSLHLDDPERNIGWAFLTGQPSAAVRAGVFAGLRRRAVDNLRRCVSALGDRRLAVTLPSAKRRPWLLSPADIAEAGAVPFLDASQVTWDTLLRGKSALDIPELMPFEGRGVVYREPDTRVATALHGFGFDVLATSPHPTVDIPRADAMPARVAIIRSRQDAWVHAWDAGAIASDAVISRFADRLVARGIPYAVLDEGAFGSPAGLAGIDALVLAPTRALSRVGLDVLTRHVVDGGMILAVEPVPHLVDGQPSPVLEGLLLHRRVWRSPGDAGSVAKALAAFLRRAKARREAGVYARPTGDLAREVVHLLTVGEGVDYMTYWHRDEAARSILLERRVPRSVETWCGSDDGRQWRSAHHWHADGRTYTEVETKPHTPHTVALRHEFEDDGGQHRS